jgi:hypothetical protein
MVTLATLVTFPTPYRKKEFNISPLGLIRLPKLPRLPKIQTFIKSKILTEKLIKGEALLNPPI